VETAQEKLNVPKQARERFVSATLLVSVIGLGLGYGLAGMFTPY
jgi:hypothetical protein